MIFSTFSDRHGLTVYRQTATPAELAEKIRATARDKKGRLPLVKLALFGGKRTDKRCLRHDANMLVIVGVEADYDNAKVSFERAVEIARAGGLHAIVYTSPSHTTEKPRWRVLAPSSKEYPPADRERLMARLAGLYAAHGVTFDAASWALSQAYFVGRVNGGPAPLVEIIDGACIDELDDLDKTAVGRPNGNGAGNGNGPFDERTLLESILCGENYHRASLSLLGHWASTGAGMLEAKRRLTAAFESVSPPDRDARWRDRFAEIPKLVDYVYGRQADKHDQQVAFTIGAASSGPGDDGVQESAQPSDQPAEEWPEPLAPAAYHGLAGEVVMAVEPHTEADAAAVLFQFLAAAGNALGHRAYYLVEDTRHHPNLFVLLIGKTGEGRKGTAWNRVRRLFDGTGWAMHCIGSGLSSGEGLITSVRDQVIERRKDKQGAVHDVVTDPGVDDKRLLLIEAEFARAARDAAPREYPLDDPALRLGQRST